MGFGAIVGQISFILIVMIVVANLIIANESNTRVFTDARNDNSKIITEFETSDILIENITVFGSAVKSINVTVRNTGKIKMNVDNFDLYINGTRISKGIYAIENVIDMINPRVFDPDETIVIRYDDISDGNSYISVVSEFGKRSDKIIFVS